jgi:hypothetical protein
LPRTPGVKQRLTADLSKLAAFYPEAKFPPVTLLVGRGRPVGITDGSGVSMGLEALQDREATPCAGVNLRMAGQRIGDPGSSYIAELGESVQCLRARIDVVVLQLIRTRMSTRGVVHPKKSIDVLELDVRFRRRPRRAADHRNCERTHQDAGTTAVF